MEILEILCNGETGESTAQTRVMTAAEEADCQQTVADGTNPPLSLWQEMADIKEALTLLLDGVTSYE